MRHSRCNVLRCALHSVELGMYRQLGKLLAEETEKGGKVVKFAGIRAQ